MGARILVLDDDDVTRKSLVELLSGYGYESFALETGEMALRSAMNDEFDIALVDLKMPGMDGIEVLRRLKTVKPGIQVIMITAFATVETAVEAMKLGAFDYITKPFKGEALDGVIKSSIEETEFEKSLMGLGGTRTEQSAVDMFRTELGVRKGLAISREDPEELVRTHGLEGAEIHWLTSDEVGEGLVNPGHLDEIERLIESFTLTNRGSVVLIHGIELLTDLHDVEKVNGFLRRVIRDTNACDSILLVSARSDSMDGSVQIEIDALFQKEYIQEMSESLANPTRRAVVHYLSIAKRPSFTEILSNIPEKESPKLSFHLKKLGTFGVITKDDQGRYYLTDRGDSLVSVLRDMDGEGMKESKTYLVYEADHK